MPDRVDQQRLDELLRLPQERLLVRRVQMLDPLGHAVPVILCGGAQQGAVPLDLRREGHELFVVHGETVGRRSKDVGHGDPYLSGCGLLCVAT
ncbi:hypothetical protein [Nocardia sp. NPDC059691]|uniref:hypothetical protein n=1 Tax=Nocardia sp. NPDC059691 TaxID=3346908 RepID=UPI003683C204